MKDYLIILIIGTCLLSYDDKEEYSVNLYGVPMADIIITNQDTVYNEIKSIKLNYQTKTNKLISKIFPIDNIYETIINKETFEILSFSKNTYQPNVINTLYTVNVEDGIKYNNTDFIIPKNCFNIFSLLYYLSITPFNQIKTIVKLEREGLIYECEIYKKNAHGLFEFELKFNLIDKKNIPIIKHTDIFTWGLFKKGGTKKIIINNSKIQQCNFKIGLSYLRANIK